jgi:chromosome segregation ATPase
MELKNQELICENLKATLGQKTSKFEESDCHVSDLKAKGTALQNQVSALEREKAELASALKTAEHQSKLLMAERESLTHDLSHETQSFKGAEMQFECNRAQMQLSA